MQPSPALLLPDLDPANHAFMLRLDERGEIGSPRHGANRTAGSKLYFCEEQGIHTTSRCPRANHGRHQGEGPAVLGARETSASIVPGRDDNLLNWSPSFVSDFNCPIVPGRDCIEFNFP